MRYIYKCLAYSWRNIVDVYLPYITYLNRDDEEKDRM